MSDASSERKRYEYIGRTVMRLSNEIDALNDENAKLWEQVERLQPKDCEGNVLDIADTVHMLRSEHDGDHEWDDVVVELALTKWGGDRWIVRGSKGEAWACECTRTGYDEDAYESSCDAEPLDDATLVEVENAKLRELIVWMYKYIRWSDMTSGSMFSVAHSYEKDMRELGIEVPE